MPTMTDAVNAHLSVLAEGRRLIAETLRAFADAVHEAHAKETVVNNFYAPRVGSAPISPEAAARLDPLDAKRAARRKSAP